MNCCQSYAVANAGFALPFVLPQKAKGTGNGTPGLPGWGSIPCGVLLILLHLHERPYFTQLYV